MTPVFLAVIGSLCGIIVVRMMIRRQLLYKGVSTARLRRLDLVLLLAAFSAATFGFLIYRLQISEPEATVLLPVILVACLIIVLPSAKVIRPLITLVLLGILLLLRKTILGYASTSEFLSHFVPIAYAALVTALFLAAGLLTHEEFQ